MWSIYEIIHIWTAVVDESEGWSSQLIFQLKQLERRSLQKKKKKKRNQGFNGIWTRDLRDTGAMLYQLSYEATHWKRGQLVEFISFHSSLSSTTAVHLHPKFKYELFHIQLFREGLSNKTVRDNAERYYGKWGFMVFDWGFRCFNDIEGNITNKSIYAFSFLVGKHRKPQSTSTPNSFYP